MSRQMRQYMPMPRRIVRMRENERRAYLKYYVKRIIECFSKCARNILKNNVPLKPRQFDSSKRQKKNVRVLAKKHTSLKEKRRIVRQRGGFLSTLILPAITALGSILAGQLFGSGTHN